MHTYQHQPHIRGTMQPEKKKTRRDLHREAAEDVKRALRALKEAKERYAKYDMAEPEAKENLPCPVSSD